MKNPVLTVVMPIYNGERYVREAIDSILAQTFDDFELIIINDGSTDGSSDIIKSYQDSRIRIINNKKNQGIPYNRNLGLKEAKGAFLCWADCDDLSLPTRFEKQLDFLSKNPDYGGCGTWLGRFKGSHTSSILKALANAEDIKASLLFRPATVPNATAMLRMSEIRKHNLCYNTELPISEDYDFVFRCAQHLKFTNIQELLYMYRDSETSIMKQFEALEERQYQIQKTIYKRALDGLGLNYSEEDLRTYQSICSEKIFENFNEFTAAYALLQKIEAANNVANIYDRKNLHKVLGNQFFFFTKKASKFGFKTFWFFLRKSIKKSWPVLSQNTLKLGIRCALKYDRFEFDKPYFSH